MAGDEEISQLLGGLKIENSQFVTLTTLPGDLFSKILTEVVILLGLRKAVKLRRVSKLFYDTITDELCYDFVFNPHGVVDAGLEKCVTFVKLSIGNRLAGHLLLAKMEHDPEHEMLSSIHRAIQTLPEKKNQTVEAKRQLKLSIWESSAERLLWTTEREKNDMREVAFHSGPGWYAATARKIQSMDPENHYEQAQTDFCVAIIADEVLIVEEMLSSGKALVELPSKYLGRPLMLAAKHKRVAIINILLLHGAKWLDKDDLWARASPAIITLIELHIVGKIALAPEPTIAALGLGTHEIELILRVVVGSCSPEIFSLLLSASSSSFPGENKIPAPLERLLSPAITYGNDALVSWMLDHGFDANVFKGSSSRYNSPLQIAAKFGRQKIARLLLEHGADSLYCSDSGKWIPVEWAAVTGYDDVMEVLLDHGVKIGVKYSFKNVNPGDHPHILRLLLARGFDLTEENENPSLSIGEVFLLDAITKGNLCMVEALLEAGVPVKENAQPEYDPVLVAEEVGLSEVVTVLKRAGGRSRVLSEEEGVKLESAMRHFDMSGMTTGEVFRTLGRY